MLKEAVPKIHYLFSIQAVTPIIIIIMIIIIIFMQGIYTYMPETNNVPREYIVAAILLLLFMVPISLVPVLALLCFYYLLNLSFHSMAVVVKIVTNKNKHT
jgi:uncharacterized membrane protein (DUF106 family)